MPQVYALTKVLLILCLFSACAAEPAPWDPIRVLLVTGGGWHDFEAQEPLLTQGLSKRIPGIEWTIVHEGDKQADHRISVMQEDAWAADYDLVVHNTSFGMLKDGDFVAHMVEHHMGTPAVLIHSAVHSYRRAEPTAEPWFRFAGLQSMWHEGERVFTVENVAPEDPIMANFPERWETSITEELYVVEKVWEDITPLARAYGVDTEAYHTVVWKHEVNGTRVFATTLGHNAGMFEQEVFLGMLANGVLWAVGR
jgi:uncharacterized protein